TEPLSSVTCPMMLALPAPCANTGRTEPPAHIRPRATYTTACLGAVLCEADISPPKRRETQSFGTRDLHLLHISEVERRSEAQDPRRKDRGDAPERRSARVRHARHRIRVEQVEDVGGQIDVRLANRQSLPEPQI